MPGTLESDNQSIVSSATGDGSTLTLTATGAAGKAVLTGEKARITVEVLANPVAESGDVLWTWETVKEDYDGWAMELNHPS